MQSLVEAPEIASDRSQSPRSKQAAARAEAAVESRDQSRRRPRAAAAAMPDPLASHVQAANRQIELLSTKLPAMASGIGSAWAAVSQD